jgi:hypothetical protein
MPCGEELWWLGRRNASLKTDDFRGVMHSRHAFDGFNGWKDNTDVFHFELVHLTPHTTL